MVEPVCNRRLGLAARMLLLSAAGLACGSCGTLTDDPNPSDSLLPVLMGTSGMPTPAEAAQWFFDPYDADKRFRATYYFANAPFGGEDVYIRGYLDHLSDPDAAVRAASAFALGMHGQPEHVPPIAERLDDDSPLVRLNAAIALQRLHSREAITPLMDATMSTGPNPEPEAAVRREAAIALGQYAERPVLVRLISALDDDKLAVNMAALESLKILTGQTLPIDRGAWTRWLDETSDPFAQRTEYVYPVFERDRHWLEYIPFWGQPPNETASEPVGAESAAQAADDGSSG